jgi:hypothetical protein
MSYSSFLFHTLPHVVFVLSDGILAHSFSVVHRFDIFLPIPGVGLQYILDKGEKKNAGRATIGYS